MVSITESQLTQRYQCGTDTDFKIAANLIILSVGTLIHGMLVQSHTVFCLYLSTLGHLKL